MLILPKQDETEIDVFDDYTFRVTQTDSNGEKHHLFFDKQSFQRFLLEANKFAEENQ